MAANLKCVLWDFGDTLAREKGILPVPPKHLPDWTKVWNNAMSESEWAKWNLGEWSQQDIAERVGHKLGVNPSEVISHLQSRCREFEWYSGPLAALKQSSLTQGLVTLNPDIFRDVIVPHWGLEELFDVVVISFEERTLDKAEICQIALDRLPEKFSPEESILIDNKIENVRGWRDRGGRGYLFDGPEKFQADLATELVEILD